MTCHFSRFTDNEEDIVKPDSTSLVQALERGNDLYKKGWLSFHW